MRLINVKTRALEEYFGNKIPSYAILSHTWEEEEVSYQQYMAGDYEQRKGYAKINMTCRIAAEQDNLDYAWVDTCCIDKDSSAELSEAINSMFRWYQRAEICYVYLSDLLHGMPWSENLQKCRWFTRGWTLQELIAPSNVIFYDSNWRYNKQDRGLDRSASAKASLVVDISRITRIDQHLLEGQRALSSYSVAQKLSWASLRQTTRVEDTAYCLFGLFDVNIPLLYGEENKAFRRFQEEIIRSTVDLSILAWSVTPSIRSSVMDPMLCGILAESPADFKNCGLYERCTSGDLWDFSTSNIGMKIRTRLCTSLRDDLMIYALPLNCTLEGCRLVLDLRKVGPHRYLRRDPTRIEKYRTGLYIDEGLLDSYLLTCIPSPSFANRFAPMVSFFKEVRKHTLRITLPASMRCYSEWPCGSFDAEDCAFYSLGVKDRAFNTIRIDWTINGQDGTSATRVRATIIALSWSKSSLGPAWPLFSIGSDAAHDQALINIQRKAMEYDLTASELLDEFSTAGIEWSTQLLVTLTGSDLAARLRIDPLCGGYLFDEIKVHGELVDMDDLLA